MNMKYDTNLLHTLLMRITIFGLRAVEQFYFVFILITQTDTAERIGCPRVMNMISRSIQGHLWAEPEVYHLITCCSYTVIWQASVDQYFLLILDKTWFIGDGVYVGKQKIKMTKHSKAVVLEYLIVYYKI